MNPLEGLDDWFDGIVVPTVRLGAGNYIGVTGSVSMAFDVDSASADAFGRLRVSSPVNLFDSTLEYTEKALQWNDYSTGTAQAAYSTNEPAVLLSVSQGNAMYARQTKQYHRYQPGKSQLILATFLMDDTGLLHWPVDVAQRVGYFDPQNGIFFEVDGGVPAFVRRYTSLDGLVREERVVQNDWQDPLKGYLPTLVTLDVTKVQIVMIDLEWLGVGRVRVGFVIDGKPYIVHTFNASNEAEYVYMATANLPIRYEIESGPTLTGTFTFKQICCSVMSEGGQEEEAGPSFTAGNGATTKSITTRRPLISIRPRLTYGAKVNHAVIVPLDYQFYAEDKPTYFEVVYGGVLTSGSFANFDTTHSAVEVDKEATAIVGGLVLADAYVPAATSNQSKLIGSMVRDAMTRLPLALTIGGGHPTGTPSDILTVVATSMDSQQAATDSAASIRWRELR
jgi:hypothetical protein